MMQFFMRYLTMLRERREINTKDEKTESDRLRGSLRSSRNSHEESEFEERHHRGHTSSQKDNTRHRDSALRDSETLRDNRVVKHGRGVTDSQEDYRMGERVRGSDGREDLRDGRGRAREELGRREERGRVREGREEDLRDGRGRVREEHERREEGERLREGRYNKRYDSDRYSDDESDDDDIPNHREHDRDRRNFNELRGLRDEHLENRRKHRGEKDDGRRGR